GRGRCRTPGRIADSRGASLSDAAGAHRCWLPARRRCGHHGAPDRSMALGAVRSAVSPADGYTLLLVGAFNAVNATLYDKLNFNFIRDIAPVATLYYVPNVMAVHPSFAAKTILEFIAYSKSNPGKVNMGSGTTGAAMHMSGELFKIMAGIDMVHVFY